MSPRASRYVSTQYIYLPAYIQKSKKLELALTSTHPPLQDSFLFFLFYTWFRSRRSHGNRRRLPVWEELAVGAAAGACARLFTTPIGNVVTRKQTASLLTQNSRRDGVTSQRELSVGEVLHVIRAEKGLAGLWAGYGATLVLTLNPSITFYLQHALAKAFAERGGGNGNGNGGAVVFLTAALSKVVATAVTYPFNIAKARLQVSAPDSPRSEPEAVVDELKSVVGGDVEGAQKSPTKAIGRRVHRLAQETIFATVLRIARTEGVGSLYDGLSGELLKAFFNHGTTMLSKDIAHGLIVRLYLFILAFVKSSPVAQALLSGTQRARMGGQMGDRISGKYGEMKDGVMRGALVLSIVEWTQRRLAIAK